MKSTAIAFFIFVLFLALTLFVLPIVFIFQIGRVVFRKESLSEFFSYCALGLDMLWGSVAFQTLGFTVSSYSRKICLENRCCGCAWMRTIDFLAWAIGYGRDHCRRAYEYEVKTWKSRGDKYRVGGK